MGKKMIWVLLGLMVLAQWLIPLQMITDSQRILRVGKPYRFKCAPIDPNDPFRGKYITLQFATATYATDSVERYEGEKRVYASLQMDSSGYAYFSALHTAPPSAGDFLTLDIEYINNYNDDKSVVLELPFQRYYLDEHDAPAAELKYNEATRDSSSTAYALVYVHHGKSRLKDVVVDGKPIKEWLLEPK